MIDLSKHIQEGARLELEALEQSMDEGSFLSAQNSAQAMQIDELKRDLAAANARAERLVQALEMMWDHYEDGTQCYEDPEEHSGYLGHAVNLSADEEQRVLALIPSQCSAAIDAAIAAKEKP